jgi:hypothetical protein
MDQGKDTNLQRCGSGSGRIRNFEIRILWKATKIHDSSVRFMQDPKQDPNPKLSEKSDPDAEKKIRIHNTANL